MRGRPIVLLNQFFYPDTIATAQILTDAAVELSKCGPVTVISGHPESSVRNSSDALSGIEVVRTSNLRFGRATATRLNSYASYLLAAAWHLVRMPRSEAVVTLTTPPLLSLLGTFSKMLRGTRHYIWEMDVYPDIAIDLNVIRPNSLLARAASKLANWSRRQADGIIVLGEEMKARLVAQGVSAEKMVICETWADGREIVPEPFPKGPLTILYSGNFGLAHEVQTIQAAIDKLGHDPRFRFIFSGGGARLEELRTFCRDRGFSNVEFQPFCTRSEVGKRLAQCDLGLVTQLPASLGSLVPCKTYGIMAAGRPLLYVGPKAATPAKYIDEFRCGWRVDPGDASALIRLLEKVAENRQSVYDSGRRARQAFEQHFDRAIGVARISAAIHSGFASNREPIHAAKAATPQISLGQ